MAGDPNVGASTPRTPALPYGVQVILASHTPEKPYHFDLIGKELSYEYGIPVAANAFKKLAIHSAPEEDGKSAKDNSKIKFREIIPVVSMLRDAGSSAHKAMLKQCEGQGFRYSPQHTVVASEDSIQGITSDIAPTFLAKLATVVNPKLLKNTTEVSVNDVNYTMLIDYGQIKDAAGTHKFYDLLRESAVESGYKGKQPVKMIDQVSLYYMLLSDPEAAPLRDPIFAVKEVQLYAPNGLEQPLPVPKNTLIHPKHFQSTPDKPNQPISDYFFDHLIQDSFRRAVMDTLMAKVLYKPAANIVSISRGNIGITELRPRQPMFAQITPGKKPGPNKGAATEVFAPKTLDGFVDLMAMEFPDTSNNNKLRTADIIVVPPHKARSYVEHLQMTLMLSSMDVARQIDPRYGHSDTTSIVMNHNGVHDEYLKLRDTLANTGMSGNFVRHPHLERYSSMDAKKIEKVALQVDRYGHTISSNDIDALYAAEQALARHVLLGVSRSPYHPNEYVAGSKNKLLPSDALVVVPFLSAGNEGLSLSQQMGDLGTHAARQGYSIVWGGMTKGGGRALMESYKANGGKHLEATSTGLLAIIETSDGRINDKLLDAWYLYPTIAPRAKHLLDRGDVFEIGAGGKGTLQEGALILLARAMEPEKYGHKVVIFADNSLNGTKGNPWEISSVAAMMRHLLPKGTAHKLVRSHDAYADRGIFFSTSSAETNAIIDTVAPIVMAKRPSAIVSPKPQQALSA